MKQRRLLIRGIVGLLIFSILALPALAKMSDTEKNQNVDLIIEKSGLRTQLAGLPGMVEQQALGAVGTNNQRLADIFTENFSVDDILAEVKLVFLREFNESNAKTILKFLESDLGARLVGYEVESAAPAFAERRNSFSLDKYSDKRRQIITKFFEAIQAQNSYYVMQSSMAESMFKAINKLLPEEAQISDAQIATMKQQIKAQVFSKEVKEAMLVDYYLIYDQVTDAEMVEYTKFNTSSAGKWMNQCIETGIVNGMQKYAEKMIIAVIAYAKENQGKVEADEEEVEDNGENIENSL